MTHADGIRYSLSSMLPSVLAHHGGAEDVCIKHRPAVASVEAFNYAVLSRVGRLDIDDVYIVAFAPFL